jgi:nicotinamidase/pyrazinamidase
MPRASLDIDAQKCFTPLCPLELPIPEGHLIVDELNQQAHFADLRIGSKDAHCPHAVWIADKNHPQLSPVEGKHVDVRWNKHAIVGEVGFELLDGLPHPADYDYFIWKGIEPDMHPYGCCYHDLENKLSTGLIEYLRINQIDTIIAGGLALDYCVKTSVLQLRDAGFNVIVNLAACRGIDSATYEQAIAQMQKQSVTFINNAAQLTTL